MTSLDVDATTTESWWRRLVSGGSGRTDLPAVETLVQVHRQRHPKADVAVLRQACMLAAKLHSGQVRKSGEPYVSHPIAVAQLLAEMGMDTDTLVAAVLHDTVEDTDYTIGQLQAEFGAKVAVLVDGVTKLDGSKWGDHAEGETFRKMLLASAEDLRVLLIKLADRLHNLRTLMHHPQREKRERIARQSLQLLVPFAERLGVHVLKREMEDLCFEVLQPEPFLATKREVTALAPAHSDYLAGVTAVLEQALADARINATILVRQRHIFSIYHDRDGDVHDLTPGDTHRLIIVVDGEDSDCYVALGVVHSLWHPLPGAFKDYIAVPKYNLYRSLHTEVVGPDEQIIGLFIRTSNQHRVSEYGLAAHVADASSAADREKVTRRPDLEWFGRLLAWQGQAKAEDYLDSLRIDLIPGTILTFTSAGQSIVLPRGATPIDFAYELSADTGNSAIGAMVDGRLRPLTAPLKDGSVVEILTSEAGRPEASWLEIAKTAAARIQIGLWLNERQTERVAATGRSMLAGEAKSRQLDLLAAETNGAVTAIARRDGYPSLDALYAAVANNDIDPTSLAADITTLMSDGTSGRQG